MKIFYEEENIRAIAEKIRDKANVDTTYTTAEMPSGVDEVYNKGYADGEANGTGTVLYGTHVFAKGQSSYEEPASTVSQELTNVRGWFYNGETVYQSNISKIEFQNKIINILASDGYGKICSNGGTWYCLYNNVSVGLPTNDDRYRAIEFRNPNEVSQEFYNLFMAIVNNSTSTTPYSVGEEAGKQAQHDEFWNVVQQSGNRTSYEYAFTRWGSEYIRPKYKVIPTATRALVGVFQECSNLKKVEAEYYDFSQVPYGTASNQGAVYTFHYCTALEEIEDVGLPAIFIYSNTFAGCTKLRTIAKIKFDENTQIQDAFWSCSALENLTIEGTIGQNGINLKWSINLSQDSIISVLNALSDSTSGLSITLSLKAVNKAFTNGVNSSLWQEWVHDKSNWTINLV
jgi:hypothetical protein